MNAEYFRYNRFAFALRIQDKFGIGFYFLEEMVGLLISILRFFPDTFEDDVFKPSGDF